MTREEFIEKAKQKYEVKIYESDESDRERIVKYVEKDSVITDVEKFESVMRFLDEFSNIRLVKIDGSERENRGIGLSVRERAYWQNSWEDKGKAVITVANMWNTSCDEINFFMSGEGCFYDRGRNFITDNVDEFLEFFLNVPCRDHEQPSGYTYQLLHDAGWYEGREEDMTELIDKCKEEGYALTDIQKSIISEFSGLVIENPRIKQTYHNRVRLRSADDRLRHHVFNNDRFIPDGVDVIEIGHYQDNVELYLSKDGRIFNHMGFPVGIDFMEGLHILLNK